MVAESGNIIQAGIRRTVPISPALRARLEAMSNIGLSRQVGYQSSVSPSSAAKVLIVTAVTAQPRVSPLRWMKVFKRLFRQRGRTLAARIDSQGDEWLPALGRVGSVDAYDRVVSRLSLDVVYELLLEQLACEPGCRVLDLGCGTGTLGSLLRRSHPEARIAGLDCDPRILVRAANRWAQGEASGALGLAQRLPFADSTFDIVTATFFLHHLTHGQKIQALGETKRVLRAGGRLHVADWTRPRRGIPAMGFALIRLLDGYERTADHAAGRLGDIMRAAGFDSVEELQPLHTWLGTLGFYRAMKKVDHVPKDQNVLR